MILFFDRSTGTTVPRTLQWQNLKFPIRVEYHETHFPYDEDDDKWLPIVGGWGWTIIGHDYSYHKQPHELNALKRYNMGCL